MPEEWHPDYEGMTWLLDWLEGRVYKGHNVVRVAMMEAVVEGATPPSLPNDVYDFTYRVLTKHRVVGLAPYVGRSFVYMWYVGVDNFGNVIASSAHVEHAGSRFA